MGVGEYEAQQQKLGALSACEASYCNPGFNKCKTRLPYKVNLLSILWVQEALNHLATL